ncbi:unnamed protein product [Strongylus vulgaris]|uniref:Uncharacterized protein n=1 Tax=Strongylus vulgaris TaxID=40348 RepID=A0A3P7JEZ5_STRVU|nr:unnamed protein product [Strongylus vulgaris]
MSRAVDNMFFWKDNIKKCKPQETEEEPFSTNLVVVIVVNSWIVVVSETTDSAKRVEARLSISGPRYVDGTVVIGTEWTGLMDSPPMYAIRTEHAQLIYE